MEKVKWINLFLYKKLKKLETFLYLDSLFISAYLSFFKSRL